MKLFFEAFMPFSLKFPMQLPITYKLINSKHISSINIVQNTPPEALVDTYSVCQKLVFCFNGLITYKPVYFTIAHDGTLYLKNGAVTECEKRIRLNRSHLF